ncbi:MAG TPA: EamA family transporter [Polyangiales bacterium]
MTSSHDDTGTGGATRGALYGLLAAALFGLSAPIAKRLLGQVSPQVLAGLLYLGAGVALHAWRTVRPATREAPLGRQDLPALVSVVVAGGVLGPLLMLVGLNRVSAVAGSLLLNLEGPFTIALAVLLFREHIGRYGIAASLLIVTGAALLQLQPGQLALDAWGAAAIAAACLAWAVDNNLTQRLSLRDPLAIVRIKALAAGGFNLTIGLIVAGELPAPMIIVGALVLGAFSYGASVVLDAYALRLIGAAREAMYFATAPFVGALAATVIVGDALHPLDLAAMGLMALGVAALLRERHSHRHVHEPLAHDHLHAHDEHHQHTHGPDVPTTEPHAHPHRHAALVHDHPHVPDAHHRHRH